LLHLQGILSTHRLLIHWIGFSYLGRDSSGLPVPARHVLEGRRIGDGAKFKSAIPARANCSQKIVAENPSRMPVIEINLQGVVANGMSSFCGKPGLEHGKRRRRKYGRGLRALRLLFQAFVIAHRAGALLPQVAKIVVARVSIRPRDVNPRSRGHVDFNLSGLSASINRDRHRVFLFLRLVHRAASCVSPIRFQRQFSSAANSIRQPIQFFHQSNAAVNSIPPPLHPHIIFRR